MQDIIPNMVRVREVPHSIGWYGVLVSVQHASIDMLVAVDGMGPFVEQYADLSVAEREGFARQAIELARQAMNTFILGPKGFQFVFPNIERME